MAKSKEAKAEFLRRFDVITESLRQLDEDTNEGYDSQQLLPQLLELYKAASPFAEAMRPKPQQKRTKRSELSELQKGVLERLRETGTVMIYDGYRKFIRTADSLDRRGLVKRNRHAIGLSNHAIYDLTEAGRQTLNEIKA